ncbi:nuclear transport factor 2 family protein [Deinococcus cellulosilyticus]|uniref:SnoaL-like domain-containing protein n=1 Tax=Deinococcus cellulosilyticus (strain DSM 18568 / NBRC 106333 / KACC 11606 / 5516J-15) TaxID=1223518 RepID=A0A511MY02_DEIC1|nr:ester cyclase [Deinococcus cellulosilyticus]GEM45472.1 hypothetical protein DC3_11070 [Deinococcus cellulosilyticus NBRC 106333 = KACC 11606]
MKKASLTTLALLALTPLVHAQTADAPARNAQEQKNLQIVTEFYDRFFNQHDLSIIPDFLDENYIQHNPTVPTGRKAFTEAFPQFFQSMPSDAKMSTEIKHIYADGDFVIVHSHFKFNPADRGSAVVDIFRLQNGKLAEHWDVIQAIPENPLNSMF